LFFRVAQHRTDKLAGAEAVGRLDELAQKILAIAGWVGSLLQLQEIAVDFGAILYGTAEAWSRSRNCGAPSMVG
jgi:hypothetical protein